MSEVPQLIGIVGFAQVGKSTTANLIAKRYGFQEVAFADPLRALAKRLNPVLATPETVVPMRYVDALWQFGYEDAKSKVPGFREFLKDLGNGVRDVLGKSTWVDAALARAEGQFTVISDVRFVNEADAVRAAGGVIVRVKRPGYGPESDFEKEVELIAADYVISNDSSRAALSAKVDNAMYAFSGLPGDQLTLAL